MRRSSTALAASTLALCATLLCGCGKEAGSPSPNFVLISFDTLRSRSLHAYGYARETSPFFDSIALGGVLFERAITTSVTTGPSHMSLFTGLYPRAHGMISGMERKRASVKTLAERLRKAGYATKAITENGFIIRQFGFGEGFDQYSEHVGERRNSSPGLIDHSFVEAERWLEERHEGPFFLFVHTYQVHAPYTPPDEYTKLFAGDRVPGPKSVANRSARDAYDQEIRYADEMLRRLFDTITATRNDAETIVIVTSDHGEEFFEHGAIQHGTQVFDESLRIPLLFWGPHRFETGRRVRAQVSLIDVAPTVLDLAGLPVPEEMDGVSLLPALLGEEEPGERQLFAEAMGARRFHNAIGSTEHRPPHIAIRSAGLKFVAHRPEQGEREAMLKFDLVADPLEQNPIPVEGAELVTLDRMVDDYLAGRTRPADESEFIRNADPGLVERLRSLGYLE